MAHSRAGTESDLCDFNRKSISDFDPHAETSLNFYFWLRFFFFLILGDAKNVFVLH